MRNILLPALVLASFLTATATCAQAQLQMPGEIELLRSDAVPKTPQELARLEAKALYGLGVLQQHRDRLVEALKTFEEAAKLDAESPEIQRALIPLYVVFCRGEDALAACRRVVEIEPGDYETWVIYGQNLRNQGRGKEARVAYARAASTPGIADRPDIRAQTNFDLAVLAEEAGDIDAALKAMSEVAAVLEKPEVLTEFGPFSVEQIREQAVNAHERMIKLCIQAKEFDRALDLYAKAKAKHPAIERRLNYHLAKMCAAQDKKAEALAHLDDYLRSQPQGVEAYELKIRLLEALGRRGEILPALRAAAGRDPHNLSLQLLVARQCQRQGEVRQAEVQYRELARESPSVDVYKGLLGLYRDEQRMGEALHLLNDALRIIKEDGKKDANPADALAAPVARAVLAVLREDPSLVKALLPEVRKALANGETLELGVQYYVAVLAARTHQLADAELLYRQFLTSGRIHPQVEHLAYDGLLRVLWEAKKYEEVVRVCKVACENSRATSVLLFHYTASRALAALGRYKEALAEADRAVELSPDENRIAMRVHRTRMLALLDDCDKALAECQELLKAAKGAGDIRDLRAQMSYLFSQKKDHDKAEEQLKLILQADPNDATANNDLGYQWADRGKNLEEAERLIRKAIDLDRQQKRSANGVSADDDKDNPAYIDSLGWVLFRRGELKGARSQLEKAASMPGGEDDPVVWDHLGDVCLRLDDVASARGAFLKSKALYEGERLRKMDDQYKELKRKLDMLKVDGKQP